MIQVKKFTDTPIENGVLSAVLQCNDWLKKHREYKIIDIKYQVINDEYTTYDYILVIYEIPTEYQLRLREKTIK